MITVIETADWRLRTVRLNHSGRRFGKLLRDGNVETVESRKLSGKRNVLVQYVSAASRQRICAGKIESFLPTIQHAVVADLAHCFQSLRIRDAARQADLNRFVDDQRFGADNHIVNQ